MRRQLDNQNEEFLNARHQARLMEEYTERIRRQKVLSGEWSEAESHQKLQAYLDDIEQIQLNSKDLRQRRRDYDNYIKTMSNNLSQALKMEKEYHFDETVGVSLKSHINQLKQKYPKAQIQTRRDRDGFAIIKVSFKPDFKYDLDTILANDPKAAKVHKAETLEALLRQALGDDSAKKIEMVKQLTPTQIQKSIQVFMGLSDDSCPTSNTSYEDRLKIRELAEERAFGRFKDDADGFVQRMQQLASEIKPVMNNDKRIKGGAELSITDLLQNLFDDRERFQQEIAIQLQMRIQDHLLGKKRVASDFVKPRFSESGFVDRLDHKIVGLERLEVE